MRTPTHPCDPRCFAAVIAIALLSLPLLSGCPSTPDPDPPAEEVDPVTGDLSLRLVDTDGDPVTGGIATVGPLGIEATSDDEGAAWFAGLPEAAYRVTVAAADFEVTVLEGVEIVAGEVTEVELTLFAAGDTTTPALRVEAATAAGRPLAGATVSVDGGAFEAVTSDEGIATLGGLPVGDLVISILPAAATPAAPWSTTLTFVEGTTEVLLVTLSGLPSDAAAWTGSDSCTECHEEDHDAWATSAHATTWSDDPPADLVPLLEGGVTAEVYVPDRPTPVEVEVVREDGVDRVRIFASDQTATFDVLGWVGAGGAVPLLDLAVGPAPGPVLWRSPTGGALGAPAFEVGLIGFHPEAWLDFDRALIDHHETGGPAPADFEAAACIGCHAVGVVLDETSGRVSTTSMAERGVGCEACHGPGSEHVAAGNDEDGGVELIVNPGRLDPGAAFDVCAACHSEGVATTSADFDVEVAFAYAEDDGWRPGRVLADALDSAPVLWPSGAAAGPNQQSDELRDSPHGGTGLYALGCGECHTPHGPIGDAPHQLAADPDDNSLCLGCHAALNFEDTSAAKAHTRHSGYNPAGPVASGRCTGCHMPPGASRSDRSELTGGGRLASHHFAPLAPAESLAAFDAVGQEQLALVEVPPNACLTCHNDAEIWFGAAGIDFHGPSGEPTMRSTYVRLSSAFALLFGEAE